MIRKFSELSDFSNHENIIGCFVDTTVLFSATYPLDSFNAESESVFEVIVNAQVPVD